MDQHSPVLLRSMYLTLANSALKQYMLAKIHRAFVEEAVFLISPADCDLSPSTQDVILRFMKLPRLSGDSSHLTFEFLFLKYCSLSSFVDTKEPEDDLEASVFFGIMNASAERSYTLIISPHYLPPTQAFILGLGTMDKWCRAKHDGQMVPCQEVFESLANSECSVDKLDLDITVYMLSLTITELVLENKEESAESFTEPFRQMTVIGLKFLEKVLPELPRDDPENLCEQVYKLLRQTFGIGLSVEMNDVLKRHRREFLELVLVNAEGAALTSFRTIHALCSLVHTST